MASGPPWLVSGFRFRARVGFSIPSSFSGPRGITPAFGYNAPHSSARGTSTLLNNALLSAHYGSVRLLPGVRARIALLASHADPAAGKPRMPTRSLGSRACSFSTCSWLSDYAGSVENSRYRSPQCGLPVRSTRSASGLRFSKLNSRPVDASVYASPGTSRHPAQDSRSRWFATPFLWGSFIPDCTPVYPDDCASEELHTCASGEAVLAGTST